MSNISSLLSSEIDSVDREILFLIIRGNPSSYAVWASMNKQMQGQGLAYVNVKKRIKRMVEMGILQKVEPAIGITNIRGRKEYKVTDKGVPHLISNIIAHPEDIEDIAEYMRINKLDTTALSTLFDDRISSTIYAANRFAEVIGEVVEVPTADNIDIILIKRFETLQRKLKTTNIMSTLQDNGMKITLSTIHPHKPKEIARLTEQNIRKMKKTLPRTPKIVKYLERLIESIDEIEAKRPTTKSIQQPLTISTKS